MATKLNAIIRESDNSNSIASTKQKGNSFEEYRWVLEVWKLQQREIASERSREGLLVQ